MSFRLTAKPSLQLMLANLFYPVPLRGAWPGAAGGARRGVSVGNLLICLDTKGLFCHSADEEPPTARGRVTASYPHWATHQATNPTKHFSTRHTTYQPTNPPTNQPSRLATNFSASEPVFYVDHSVAPQLCWLVGVSFARLFFSLFLFLLTVHVRPATML